MSPKSDSIAIHTKISLDPLESAPLSDLERAFRNAEPMRSSMQYCHLMRTAGLPAIAIDH